MSKKESKGQWAHYEKWTTDEGYTFLAKDKEDAKKYLEVMGHLGSLEKLRSVDGTL
tara:strand:- start:550 stop:717 length:168 start_codon:yes stop_codon:yes gene_type:complete